MFKSNVTVKRKCAVDISEYFRHRPIQQERDLAYYFCLSRMGSTSIFIVIDYLSQIDENLEQLRGEIS